ncbi:MAG: YlxR family protein [Clostridiales bacterium]|nr:YlxR family protein [Clostridiales bacterium]
MDTTGKKAGRGAYICPDAACLQRAMKSRALERSFETAIGEDVYAALQAQIGG